MDSITADFATQLTVVIDIATGAATGARDVTVTNSDGGAATAAGGFTVTTGPTISSFAPGGGSNTTATPPAITNLTVTGSGFVAGSVLSLRRSGYADVVATGVTVGGGTTLSGSFDLTGQAPGRWIVQVDNADGGHVEQGDGVTTGFLVSGGTPTVTAVSPSPSAAGTTGAVLTLTGTNFARGAVVAFSPSTGITLSNPTWVSLTSYQVTVDIAGDAALGARSVTLTNADSQASAPCTCFTLTAAPTVSGVDPASRGQGAIDQPITITGTGFGEGAAASVSGTGVTVANVVVASATEITADLSVAGDAATGERTLTVTNTDGGSAGTTFTVNPKPVITSMTPASRGQNAADQIIVVDGTNFVDTPDIQISGEGITLNAVNFVSPTELELDITIAPDAPTGARDVTIINPDAGTSIATGAFTVNVGPTVQSLSPDNLGADTSNASVVVTGSGFAGEPTPVFSGDGITVHSVTRDSATQLTLVISIAEDAEQSLRDLTITNPDGGSIIADDVFAIHGPDPIVTSITPSSGSNSGSVTITDLAGSRFAADAEVQLERTGFEPVPLADETVLEDGTRITGSFDLSPDGGPPVAPGDWTVHVSNPTDGGTGTLFDGFTVAGSAPNVTGVAPNTVSQGATISVDLSGSNFADGAIVTAGAGITVSNTIVVSATLIEVDLTAAGDAALGTRTLTVTNTDSQSDSCDSCVTVIAPPPTVTSVTPSSGGQAAQDRSLVIAGTGFDATPTVSFSGAGITVDSVTRNSATQLTVVVDIAPTAATGARDVTVTNSDSGSTTAIGGFTVNVAPTTTSLSPNSVPRGSLRPVTITGTGYAATPTVTASGSGVTFQNVTWNSATQLTATVGAAPGAAVGARDVTVVNPDGGVSICTGCLTVTTPGNIVLDGWIGVGDALSSTPGVASIIPDTAGIFYRAPDNSVQLRTFAGNTFQPSVSLGGIALGGPASAAAGGVIDVVVRGSDDAIWINTCSGGSCGGWSSLGGLTFQAPAAAAWGPGRLDVFVAGTDNQLWQRTRVDSTWGAWTPLGGILTAGPAATSTGVGNIEVAVRGNDGAVWVRSFNGTWGSYSTVGGFIVNEPALVARPAGFVDLFVRGGDNRMWYAPRTSGTWGGFSELGGILTSGPAAALIATSPEQVVMVAVRGSDGNLWVNRARYP